MNKNPKKVKPKRTHPWVASYKHLGAQGLAEFGERQRARLEAVRKKQHVVKV